LITNNFRIKSSNHGIIYTYAVEFIDGEVTATATMPQPQPEGETVVPATPSEQAQTELVPTQSTIVRDFACDNLETFQKYKIMGA